MFTENKSASRAIIHNYTTMGKQNWNGWTQMRKRWYAVNKTQDIINLIYFYTWRWCNYNFVKFKLIYKKASSLSLYVVCFRDSLFDINLRINIKQPYQWGRKSMTISLYVSGFRNFKSVSLALSMWHDSGNLNLFLTIYVDCFGKFKSVSHYLRGLFQEI
jgi:hypothetical protein